jgi:tight adherence protein B
MILRASSVRAGAAADVVRLDRPAAWLTVAACAAVLGLLLAGAVAAILASGYAAVAARWLGRRERRRATELARGRVLDSIGSLAADLRAGLPPHPSDTSTMDATSGASDPLSTRVLAAVSLAESTGAPLADLIERIEADARASDRAAAAAEAQRAGARATTLLLAGLPAAGIALGHAIGADPLRVLLHTPIGAACALAALALQLTGLAWSARLARPAVS